MRKVALDNIAPGFYNEKRGNPVNGAPTESFYIAGLELELKTHKNRPSVAADGLLYFFLLSERLKNMMTVRTHATMPRSSFTSMAAQNMC